MSENTPVYDVQAAQAVIAQERNRRATDAAAELDEFLQSWRKRRNCELQFVVQSVPARDGYGFVQIAIPQVVAL